MIIRKIRAQELERCQQLFAVAFECGMAHPERSAQEAVDAARLRPSGREEVYWDSRWAAFEDDDATMMATFAVLPWTANFDGHAVPMAGIGGVASLPQYRRGGAIRGCFEAALRDMYASGFVFSYLYPFSNAFYRKFGYELACDAAQWRLRLAGLPERETAGSWRLCEPERTLEADIRAIDALRQKRYNGMVIAGDMEYLWTRENPFATKVYTYVYYDAAGVPLSYMTLVPEANRELTCRRFVFNDREGLLGLLALLRRFAADHSHASMALPVDVDLQGLLSEYCFGNVERSLLQRGMARAVNVEAMLRMARMRGAGELVVAVRDDQIPENNAAFELRFAEERANTVRRTEATPDVALTVQDFSRLILGCCAAADPMWLPDVELNCAPERAAQVFYRKPAFISQYF